MYQEIQQVLGTTVRIVVNTNNGSAIPAITNAFTEAFRIDQTYSRFLSGNFLSQMNATLAQWQTVTPECFALLLVGKQLETLTKGAFSLSVKTVLESWGYNDKYELEKEFGNGITGIFDLGENNTVFLRAPVEFGAIGKGYALDAMQKVLQDFENIFINAGGDIYARGKKENGEPWKCFLEHPEDENQAVGEIVVDDFFLASSSPLKRRWRNRHHLVDARTKEPASTMLATYVHEKTGILADGYSTALFVLGFENAQKICISEHLRAFLVGKNQDAFISDYFLGKKY